MYNKLLSRVIYPLNDVVSKERICESIRFLSKNEYSNKRTIEAIQERKLVKMLRYAIKHVPYYKRIACESGFKEKDIQSKKDIRLFPYLNKEKLRQYGRDDLLSDEINGLHYYKAVSSGSTGEPIHFLIDNSSKSIALAAQILGRNRAGYQTGDKILTLWGNFTTYMKNQTLKKKLADFLKREYTFPSFKLADGKKYNDLLEMANKIQPHFLYGYTNAIFSLAEFIENSKKTFPPVKAIFTTATNLSDSQRAFIEHCFDCKIFDQYGCGEILSIAHECEKHAGYHVEDLHVFLEYDYASAANTTKAAELVVTDLDNFVMPFIRYKNGDLVEPKRMGCECGRSGNMLKRILGRQTDVIRTKNGGYLTVPTFFGASAIQSIQGLLRYQIVQKDVDYFVMRIKVNNLFDEQDEKTLTNLFYDFVGKDSKLVFNYSDNFELDSSGKFRLVVSKL